MKINEYPGLNWNIVKGGLAVFPQSMTMVTEHSPAKPELVTEIVTFSSKSRLAHFHSTMKTYKHVKIKNTNKLIITQTSNIKLYPQCSVVQH